MEDQLQENNQPTPRNSNLWLYIVLVVLALGIIGVSVWLISTKNEVKQLRAEKDVQKWELERELDSLVLLHVQVKAEYGEVSDSLAGMDSLFQANAKEIKSLLNYKWEFYKVKKKLNRLQVVAQTYVRRMDSIVVVNEILTIENLEMQEEIKIEKRKNKSLEKEKVVLVEIVDEASILSTYNLKGTPVHVKGSGKEAPTDKVKRVKRINVCFTLSENMIVGAGEKILYVRIAQPDKEILIAGRGDKYLFEHQGESLQFSAKKKINYQNEAMEICMKYNIRGTQEIQAGLYHVDVFDGDNNIGHTTFSLR
jgi:cell division protein FtsB